MVKQIPEPNWLAWLNGFTERNAGRRTTLEIDDPALGAVHIGENQPLRGVVYDRKDDRIEIMLGGFEGVGPHLTHTIPGVTALDVVEDSQGRETVLRIAHDTGQTLLHITPRSDSAAQGGKPW